MLDNMKNAQYSLTEVFLAFVFSVYILFPGFHGYSSIQEEKTLCFLLFFGGYLLCMASLETAQVLMSLRKIRCNPIALWRKASFSQRAVVCYFLVTLISALISPFYPYTLLGMSRYEGLLTIGIYCGCFLFVSVYGQIKLYHWYVLAATMTVYCGICLLQFAGKNPLWLYPDQLSYLDANIAYPGIYLGLTGNAGFSAALLTLTIPLFAANSLFLKRNGWIFWIPLLLSVIVLYVMDIKAGLVGLLCGSALSIPMLFSTQKAKRIRLGIGVGCTAVMALLTVYFLPMRGILLEMQEMMHGNARDVFGSGRVYIWKEVLKRVADLPFFGAGPDTLIAIGIPGETFTVGDITYPTVIDAAHNEYLNVLYHQGILGLAAYLSVLIALAVKWVKTGAANRTAAVLGYAVLCYCIQAFFGISTCLVAGLFWVVLGLMDKYQTIRREEQ